MKCRYLHVHGYNNKACTGLMWSNPTPSSNHIHGEKNATSPLPRLSEKQPGNICTFKLLLPLPESWHYQSSFRMLSHDNSKTQLHHTLQCCNHVHSICNSKSFDCSAMMIITSVYSLNLQKLPGCFTHDLETRLQLQKKELVLASQLGGNLSLTLKLKL